MARLLALLVLLLTLSVSAHAQTTTGTTADGLVWSASNSQITITGYTSALSGAVDTPSSINVSGSNLPVTIIGAGAFQYCSMTSITIPNSVTSIGDYAFCDCGLTSITIPCSVTSIGTGAFSDCNRLFSVTIPDSVMSIGDYVFCNCGSLASLTIPDSVTSIGVDAFSNCGGLITVTIPNSVTDIGDYAFYGCTSLTSVTIPNRVSSIGDSVFAHCTGLTSLTIPNSVTKITGWAFRGCTSLTSVTIPSSVNYIYCSAFQGCTSLKAAVFMGNAPYMVSGVFDSTASGFTVYYFNGATGFTSPTWFDNSGDSHTAVNMGASSPVTPWLISKGLAYDSNLQSAPNGDGVSLLMAYALNLDPTCNQSRNIPRPVVVGNNMSLTYYAASAGITYTVQTSTDLKTWGMDGVTLSGPDANNCYTATVPITAGAPRFMRLAVVK